MNKRITYPDSAILTSAFIPFYFEPIKLSTIDASLTLDDNFIFDQDSTGSTSVIRLDRIPYIDLNKYDYQRKKWYGLDQYGNRWKIFAPGDWVPEIGDNGDYWWKEADYNVYVSADGLFDADWITLTGRPGFTISQFSPITIKLNGINLTDITNYSGDKNVVTKLDNIDSTNNKEFYYDKRNSIYTNQDLSLYNIDDIELTYYTNIKDINVKCRMATNITNLSPYTPVVDFFVLKMTGQNL